jgi:hypothetical protein
MSKWLYLSALMSAVAIILVLGAHVWGWPHVIVWAVLGAIAGGLAGFPASKRRKPHA